MKYIFLSCVVKWVHRIMILKTRLWQSLCWTLGFVIATEWFLVRGDSVPTHNMSNKERNELKWVLPSKKKLRLDPEWNLWKGTPECWKLLLFLVVYREEAREMFYHAYNAYMDNAYPADELMPLSCKGRIRGVSPSRGDLDDVLGK